MNDDRSLEHNPDIGAIVASVYALTLTSRPLQDTLTDLTRQVSDCLARPGGDSPHGQDGSKASRATAIDQIQASLSVHVGTAIEIQAQLENKERTRDPLNAVVDDLPNAALICDRCGRIVACNRAAQRLFPNCSAAEAKAQPASLAAILNTPAGPQTLEAVLQGIQQAASKQGFVTVPLLPDRQDIRLGCALIKRMNAEDLITGTRDRYLVSLSAFSFSQDMVVSFARLYNLTGAEAQVAVALSEGRKPEEIAQHRSAKLSTIRTQIKAIKSKTSVNSIPDLVRLMCGFVVGVQATDRLAPAVSAKAQPKRQRMSLTDGRSLEYLSYGADTGRPVICFHSLGYGGDLPTAAKHRAKEQGLRVIAPYRAGYGGTDARQADLTSRDQCTADLVQLMDQLAISQADIVAHGGGPVSAGYFATRYPERLRSLTFVAHAPVSTFQEGAVLTPWVNTLHSVSKLVPAATRLNLKAALKRLEQEDPRQVLTDAFQISAPDLAVLEDPEIFDLILSSIRHTMRPGVEAYATEWAEIGTDLTESLSRLSCPTQLIYGRLDPVVPRQMQHRVSTALPQAKVHEIAEGGHLIFYSHWQEVLTHVAQIDSS